jgi:hypothetical protein
VLERADQDALLPIVGPPGPSRRLAIAQLAAIFREYEVPDRGHIADGGVHFNLFPRTPMSDNPSRIAALRDHVLEMACGILAQREERDSND